MSGRATAALAPLLLCAALLACASTPPPETGAPIDWAAVADVRVPQIVTIDPDGDVRETSLWLVVVDGAGFVRTGETRWFENLDRDPKVVLRIGGAAYPLQAKLEVNPDVRRRVNDALREKYGFQDRFVGWFSDREAANIVRLGPRR
jgi:hypothetical protein